MTKFYDDDFATKTPRLVSLWIDKGAIPIERPANAEKTKSLNSHDLIMHASEHLTLPLEIALLSRQNMRILRDVASHPVFGQGSSNGWKALSFSIGEALEVLPNLGPDRSIEHITQHWNMVAMTKRGVKELVFGTLDLNPQELQVFNQAVAKLSDPITEGQAATLLLRLQ